MTSPVDAPRLNAEDAERLAADLFGLTARATALPSERDQNFRVQSADGDRVSSSRSRTHAKTVACSRPRTPRCGISRGRVSFPCHCQARPGPTSRSVDGHFVRLLTWLDGRPLGETARHSHALLVDLGRSVGSIDSRAGDVRSSGAASHVLLGSGTRPVGHSATPAACARRLGAPHDRIAHRDLSGNGRSSCCRRFVAA